MRRLFLILGALALAACGGGEVKSAGTQVVYAKPPTKPKPPKPIQCWDGSTVKPPATCPPTPPEPVTCSDGSEVVPPAVCPEPPKPITCYDGSTVVPPAVCPEPPKPVECWDGTAATPPAVCPEPPPPVTCWDGSTATPPAICPEPPKPPVSSLIPAPSISGLAPVNPDFDPKTQITPSWGSGAIAPSASPDVVGAFRFICPPTKLTYDDPIVFPGQPGKSHLHQWYCSPDGDANSTYENTMKSSTQLANKTLYWMTAMLDGKGNAIQPDWVSIYYKRRPLSDPMCQRWPLGDGECIPIPNGLRFIDGYDWVTGKTSDAFYFNCDGNGSIQGHYKTVAEAIPNCRVGGRFGIIINVHQCWSGKYVSTLNGRDHMSHKVHDNATGRNYCPESHPYSIPEFQLAAWYSIVEGDDLSQWRLSSDAMRPDLPFMSTFHIDYFEDWPPEIKVMWTDNCINKKLNCSGGDMGNGKQMRGFSQPSWGFGINPHRLVPIDSIPHP